MVHISHLRLHFTFFSSFWLTSIFSFFTKCRRIELFNVLNCFRRIMQRYFQPLLRAFHFRLNLFISSGYIIWFIWNQFLDSGYIKAMMLFSPFRSDNRLKLEVSWYWLGVSQYLFENTIFMVYSIRILIMQSCWGSSFMPIVWEKVNLRLPSCETL